MTAPAYPSAAPFRHAATRHYVGILLVARLTAEITAIVTNGRTRDGMPQPNDQPWWDDLTWLPQPTK